MPYLLFSLVFDRLQRVVVRCTERYEEIEMLTPIICLRLLPSLTATEGRLPHKEIRDALYVTSSSCVYFVPILL